MTNPEPPAYMDLGHDDEISDAFEAYDRLVRWEEHDSRLDAVEPFAERAYARGKIIAMVANFAAEALGVTSGEDATTPNGDAILASREAEADARLAELEAESAKWRHLLERIVFEKRALESGTLHGPRSKTDKHFWTAIDYAGLQLATSARAMQSAPIAAPADTTEDT